MSNNNVISGFESEARRHTVKQISGTRKNEALLSSSTALLADLAAEDNLVKAMNFHRMTSSSRQIEMVEGDDCGDQAPEEYQNPTVTQTSGDEEEVKI